MNPILREQGIECQRIPGHVTTRGHHSDLAPYELLAIDLKTDLPKTRQGCTICMIVVCLFSMKRHTIALKKKHEEYEAFRSLISQIYEGQGFKTRRLRIDISGEQTSHKMIEYCISKGIKRELVPHAHSPQSNPTKRQLQTLFQMIRVVRLAAQLPRWLWDELADAIYKVDACLPVRNNPVGKPPDAMITGTVPDLSCKSVRLSFAIEDQRTYGHLRSREGTCLAYIGQ